MKEQIKAPLAGKIISILVNEGDIVEDHEEIMILEAMKMESSIYSNAGGRVSRIRVKAGDSVKEDEVLMVLE